MTLRLPDWRPTATRERLALRAALLTNTRAFFAARGVLEVETPYCVRHAVTDPQLHSLQVTSSLEQAPLYLHTSAEYAMKRLLASGSGDIYQLCHVFRDGEQGPLHNREFTMLEWYRVGWSMRQLMTEVATLLRELVGARCRAETEYVSYAEVLRRGAGVDVLCDTDDVLAARATELGFDRALVQHCGRDELLDLLMATRVGPSLGRNGLCFLTHYPASQAALARLDASDPRVALRFEVYLDGIELANGFEELTDAAAQRARFENDQQLRLRAGAEVPAADERLLQALAAGLPPCSGVAVGFDRVLMLAAGAGHIDEVLAFPASRA
jgi:elongation factor P--(R)-beta-lysine ligase